MKDNFIIALLLGLIALFFVHFRHASPYITQEHLDEAVAQSVETYIKLEGYETDYEEN